MDKKVKKALDVLSEEIERIRNSSQKTYNTLKPDKDNYVLAKDYLEGKIQGYNDVLYLIKAHIIYDKDEEN